MTEQVFVARERELAQLQTFLDRALAGHGQICLVTGEAGAGKTALVTEFARRVQEAHPDLLVALGVCNAQTGIGDPYLPFRQVLGMLTGDVEGRLAQGAITKENATRLRDFLRVSGQALVDLGPDLIDILVPGAGLATRAGAFLAGKVGWLDQLEALRAHKAATAGGAGIDQNRVFEQVTNVLTALALQRPLLVLLDDLHWADLSSISLLFHLSRSIAESPILMLGTYRPEDVVLGRAGERHPLESMLNEIRRYQGDVWLDLGQIVGAEGRAFVDACLDTEPNQLGEDFREALFRHTHGHALFTTELLREMQDRGDIVQDEAGRWVAGTALDWDALPAKVEGVIAERIGRLATDLREVLTIASVEGEEFTGEVVARVQAQDERGLVRRLSGELDKQHRLVSAQGLKRLGQQRLSVYRFRHNLFQQYLYTRLDEMERSFLHEDVGKALEALYGDQTGEIAVQLARHFEAAGMTEKAVEYLLRAGKRAVRLSAYEEAIGHLTRGLALLQSLPKTPERVQQELKLQITLGVPLTATKTYGAPEVEQTYTRARELCRQIGETPHLFPVLAGLRLFYMVRAEHQTARDLAEQCLRLAQKQHDPDRLVPAYWALGITCYFLGELAAVHTYLEQAITLYDPQQHRAHAFLYGFDSGVVSLSYSALNLAILGHLDQARRRSWEALARARELSHPYNLAAGQWYAAWLHYLRREWPEAQAQTEAVIALATEQGFKFWLAAGTILHGAGLVEMEEIEVGITQMRQGLAITLSSGAEVARSWFLALLAEACGKGGQPEEGLDVLAEALAFVKKKEERFWVAELHRLKGELLLMQDSDRGGSRAAPTDEVEACFRQAIEVARRQQAKSLELRATTSLARLWQQQGRGEEGREMLAEIYNWFTEGFDTPDLIEAKALLEALSA